MRNAVVHRYALANSTNPLRANPQKSTLQERSREKSNPQKAKLPKSTLQEPIPQISNPQESSSPKSSTAPQAPNSCAKCNLSFKESFQLREVSGKIWKTSYYLEQHLHSLAQLFDAHRTRRQTTRYQVLGLSKDVRQIFNAPCTPRNRNLYHDTRRAGSVSY